MSKPSLIADADGVAHQLVEHYRQNGEVCVVIRTAPGNRLGAIYPAIDPERITALVESAADMIFDGPTDADTKSFPS